MALGESVAGGPSGPSHLPSFFFNDPATTELYPLSLHDALPISDRRLESGPGHSQVRPGLVFLVLSDPGAEGVADPRSGPQGVEGRRRLRRGKVLGRGDGSQVFRFREPPVEGVQEFLAVVFVVLPGVLAVEEHGDEVWAGCALGLQLRLAVV